MNFKNFIQEFNNQKGGIVVLAALIEKIGGFLIVIIALNFISKSQFGFFTYANITLTFIIPFIGFGVHQGLIRFGALSKSQYNKKLLFNVTLKKGLKYSVFLILAVVLFSPLTTINNKESLPYLLVLSIQLLSLFVFEVVRIYVRLIHLNKLYAKITIFKTIFMVLFVLLFTLKFKGIGYAISLSVVPLIVAVFYIYKLKLLTKTLPKSTDINIKEFISYGMYMSFGSVLSELLFSVDILLIGNLLQDELLVAHYKAATVFPFSFLFLVPAFIRSNFVKLSNKSSDKNYVKNYYLNYLKIFSVLSILILLFFYFFSDYIFFFFGEEYKNEYDLMFIFAIGVAGALLFRNPLGNILSAIGLPKIHAINSLIVLIFNVILSYILIKKMGMIGAAIATSIMFWFSGLLSLIAFAWYLKK